MKKISKKLTSFILAFTMLIIAIAPTQAHAARTYTNKITLYAGETLDTGTWELSGGKVSETTKSWKSSNKKVATVKNGRITAKKAGKATISVKGTSLKNTYKAKVTVKEAPFKVSMRKTDSEDQILFEVTNTSKTQYFQSVTLTYVLKDTDGNRLNGSYTYQEDQKGGGGTSTAIHETATLFPVGPNETVYKNERIDKDRIDLSKVDWEKSKVRYTSCKVIRDWTKSYKSDTRKECASQIEVTLKETYSEPNDTTSEYGIRAIVTNNSNKIVDARIVVALYDKDDQLITIDHIDANYLQPNEKNKEVLGGILLKYSNNRGMVYPNYDHYELVSIYAYERP